MPKPRKIPAKPPEVDLDAISESLTDDQLKKLLSMRLRLIKEEMILDLILDMKRTLKEGVEIVFNGEIMDGRRRLSPGEQDRYRRTLASFNPSDIATFLKDADKSAAEGLAADSNMDLDELSTLTRSPPTR